MTVQCDNCCICTSYRVIAYQPQYSKALLHIAQLNKVPEPLPHLQSLILLLKVLKLLRLVGDILSSLPSSFTSIKLLVEVDKDHSESEATDNADTEHGQDDTVRLAITVLRQVPDVRTGNVTELRKGVDHSDGNSSLGRRTREGRRDPRVAVGFVSHWKCRC